MRLRWIFGIVLIAFDRGPLGKLDAVVGQDRVDRIGNLNNQISEEITSDNAYCMLVWLDVGKLRCPVEGNQQLQSAFIARQLGDIDVEVDERIRLEFLLLGLIVLK